MDIRERGVAYKSSLLGKDLFGKAFKKCIIYPLELSGYHVYSREGRFFFFLIWLKLFLKQAIDWNQCREWPKKTQDSLASLEPK